ncbi:ABC-type amino acid transport system permease subunit [Rhizobium ruizarguesonis]
MDKVLYILGVVLGLLFGAVAIVGAFLFVFVCFVLAAFIRALPYIIALVAVCYLLGITGVTLP